ncbi:MAG: alpha-galactosidase [bacterium]
MKSLYVFFFIFIALMVLPAMSVGMTDELTAVQAWYARILADDAKKTVTLTEPVMTLVRQDYNTLKRNKSVLDTPLKIGNVEFAHGLGTHSFSIILIDLPSPAKTFTAQVGIDNNYDTKGEKGSVVFVVEADGKESFRSGICKGGNAPLTVNADLAGAKQVTLKVLDGDDGPGWDQSDWGDAKITMADGKIYPLNEIASPKTAENGLLDEVPFSFIYNGKSSSELLPQWKKSVKKLPVADKKEQGIITYTDPNSGMEITCQITRALDYPSIEWVIFFKNTGTTDTPIIEQIRGLDLHFGSGDGQVTLHHSYGSTASASDFIPIDSPVSVNQEIKLAPNGGRSSDGALPFFNLQYPGGGLTGAIGWTGQWEMTTRREGKTTLHLTAGQQTTHMILHAGESIRTPRILLVSWQGNEQSRGTNYLRRTLVAHYLLRRNGELAVPPLTSNTWFTFNEGNNVNKDNQFAAMIPMQKSGLEGYWLDAGWFEGGWPNGAGNWTPRKDGFPDGLKPIGDEAHRLGMKFVLWFEPERVNPNSKIMREHAAWVLRQGGGDGLFNMGDPDARRWLTDMLNQCITDWGIDVYRNDFNIDPLRFWKTADTADRQGISENKYITGLYAMWDELLTKHPGLTIDNCASGGRRIDFEMLSRSYPLWHSDSQCSGEKSTWDQTQAAGLNIYVPMHAAGVWSVNPYHFRSVATTGTSFCMDMTKADFPIEQAKKMTDEVKSLRLYYQGDYYPLLPINQDTSHWCGWQFNRPELGKGCAIFFRRENSPFTDAVIKLYGIDLTASYNVTNLDTGIVKELKGADLATAFHVNINTTESSVVYVYEKIIGKE